MKIHFVLPQLVPAYGMEKAAVALMDALAAHGCSVSCCTLSGPVVDAPPSSLNAALGAAPGFSRLLRAVPRLRRHLDSIPPDTHIVASGLWAALPVGCSLAGTGRPYVAWEHSVLPVRLEVDRRVSALFRGVGIPLLRPRTVVAVSAGVQQTVRDAWRGTVVEAIPNIVQSTSTPPELRAPRAGQSRLVTVGAFRQLKNTHIAVQALQHLPKSFVLDLAGDGPEEGSLRATVDALGLESRVRFLGRVQDVAGLLAEADLLVHPSRAETFGLSLFEAADAGIPVAAFRVAAVDEAVPRYVPGALAGQQTAASLAETIRHLTDSPPSLAATLTAWRRRTAELAPEKVAAQWCQALGRSTGALGAVRRSS